jgi:hypothetical protein
MTKLIIDGTEIDASRAYALLRAREIARAEPGDG